MLEERGWWSVVWRTAVVHTVTYFVVGLAAFLAFDYEARFAEGALAGAMRPADDPLVQAGVLFQPVRGALYGLIFYLLRDVLFAPRGWWVTWLTLLVIGIVAPFGVAPGSIEGVIYTTTAFDGLWGGLAEVTVQAFFLAVVLHYWVTAPANRLRDGILLGAFALALLIPLMGLAARQFGLAGEGP